VRGELESISDVEGVREQLDRFPECVLLGGIAARRELVAALLGEHAHAGAAAAALVAPGKRQPLALELRCAASDEGGLALASLSGPEADAWLSGVTQAASVAVGARLKVDSLRLRLSAVGCANLDVVDLPDRDDGNGGTHPKIEEMHLRHLGSSSSVLVCLEPGQPMELCRRFDPRGERTVLLGAAAGHQGNLPASELFGSAAAKALEVRFAALCSERAPQWLAGLTRFEAKLAKAGEEAKDLAQKETSEEVLRHARAAGISFGRAFEHVIGGTPGCSAGALTLEEELVEFAGAAARGECGAGTLSSECTIAAVADMMASFEGVQGYATYLRNTVSVPGADVPLNGGAAWQRLLSEIEVAVRLARPPPEDLAGLTLAAIQPGGTGVHGHQRWEDVSAKLLLGIAFEPLRRRIRYVAARVAWALRQQKVAVAEWMSTLEDGVGARLYSPLFPQHLALLRSSPVTRDLVFGAFDKAAAVVAEQLLRSVEGTLTAGCINAEIMFRPHTELVLKPPGEEMASETKPATRRSGETRNRVKAEVRRRSGPAGGLPVQLRDRVFEPKDAEVALPYVELKLMRAFGVLANVLANQSYALSDTILSSLTRRHLDEAMNAIDFSVEQQKAIGSRHAELQATAQQIETRLAAVRRCVSTLRSQA
jgi:hypothetical protein